MIPELDIDVTGCINHTMEQELMPERYRETFYNDSGSSTLIWLPESTSLYHTWCKHIRHILSTTTNAMLTCLAAKDNDEAATAIFTPHDL
jgi:hypothetical protein